MSSAVSSTVLDDYLGYNFTVTDSLFNDLLSEFDANTNDIQCFDGSKATLHSTAINTDVQNLRLVFDEVTSLDPFTSLIEQQASITNHESLISAQSSISLNYQEVILNTKLSSADISTYQIVNTGCTRDETTAITLRSSSPSVLSSIEFPNLIQTAEPLTFTLEQFQELIRTIPSTSQSNIDRISTLLENKTIIANNIPLKIVQQTNHIANTNSSDKLNHQDSILNNDNNESAMVNGNESRRPRKLSSCAIEKRYRSSINEKIFELKEIVAATDGKIQKSGILRRTVEYIRQLQSTNRQLDEENRTLKNILKQLNLTHIDFPNNNNVQSSEKNSSIENATSTYSSDSNDDRCSPAKKRQKTTKSARGMVDGSRLVLCCFMLCVLMTNPFNYLLDHIHSSSNSLTVNEIQSKVSSRTLQTTKTMEDLNLTLFFTVSWKQLVTLMLNIAICLVCLVKIFVHGEPIVQESDMDEYYAYKKKANILLNDNRFHEATVYYQKCCEKLYISMDNTYLYYFSSITWQIIRLFLNIIFVGRWLTYWSGWTKAIDTRYYNGELNHCYLQLWKIEYHHSKSLLNLFNLSLLTINTSINAGKKLHQNKRNEIYFLSALTMKKFDGLFAIFTQFFLKCLIPMDMNDAWLLDIQRLNQFIFEKNIYVFKQKSFLESIRIQFFEYILYDNIRYLLSFQDEQQQIIITNKNELDQFTWWQHSLQVLHCISNDNDNIHNITATDLFRSMISSDKTIYYMARSTKIVNDQYITIVEKIHITLLMLTDNDDQTNATRIFLLENLGKSSRLLTSMNEQYYITDNDDNLDMAIKTLLLDSILSLRLRLLTSSMTNDNQRIPFLDDFQRELDCYRRLNQLMKLPKQKLYLFESIFRASSGLNPLLAQTLFECAIKQLNSMISTKEESSPSLDIIAALLLFCHFSPSTIYRYRNILQQAACISSKTSKNNDLNRLQQQCLTLIRQPYFAM